MDGDGEKNYYDEPGMQRTETDRDVTQVEQAMTRTGQAEDELGRLVLALRVRLESVLRPHGPEKATMAGEPLMAVREEPSPHVAALDTHTAALHAHANVVRDMLERLDV